MKKAMKVLGVIALAVIIGFGVTACGGGGGGQKAFNGAWVQSGSSTITISDKELIYNFSNKFTINSVTTLENTNEGTRANYPNGFRFDCSVTESTYLEIGSHYSINIFMHKNKKEFVVNQGTNAWIKQ